MPTDVIGVLLGYRQTVMTAQLARLRRAGLAHDQVFRLGPLLARILFGWGRSLPLGVGEHVASLNLLADGDGDLR